MIVKSFCCCCPLVFGAVVIGVIYFVEASCLLGLNIYKFNNLKLQEYQSYDEVEEIKQSSKNCHLLIILSVIQLLSTSLIFLGLRADGSHWVLTTAGCSFVIHLLMLLNACVRALLVKLIVYEVLFFSVAFLISYYCMLVLWSYGKEMEEKRNAIYCKREV